jgi:hypothetical protein
MPRGTYFTYPIDEPAIEREGLMHRETDFHGSMKYLYVKPEHPLRAAKGDLGLEMIKDFAPRYSFEGPHKSPYKNLRKGK